jgi:predicted O-linked N-acetylglucosamine transferase (SPINDLY family)
MTLDEAMDQAIAHHKEGRLAEAERLYWAVLKAMPDHPAANHFLGLLAGQSGHVEGGLPYLEAAARLRPDISAYHATLGRALRSLGRWDEALIRQARAVELRPDWAEGHAELGEILSELGRNPDAAACYRKAIALRPDYAEAHCDLGGILRDLGLYQDSLDHFGKALALRPDMAEVSYNMAITHNDLGYLDEAIASYKRTLAVKPEMSRAHCSLLTTLLYHSGWTSEAVFAEHRRFEAIHARPHYPTSVAFANSPEPGRRLRIGYLSGDFRKHPVGRNLIPLIEAHDHDAVELFFYSNALLSDDMTERFRRQADGWRPVAGLDDRSVADVIRADSIDILVVLAGHFDSNRPLVAAYRPAPVQISFHDPATSGLEVMDYIISDPVLSPRRLWSGFTERPIRLPSYYLHDPIEAPPPAPLPPLLAKGHPTFVSFNNPAKLSDSTLALWARLLHRLPDARLVLKYKNWFTSPAVHDRVFEVMRSQGVGPERIDILGSVEDMAEHLGLYSDFDIALDPFPFNGSTTTFEALWMGVPVVTLPGETMSSRWSASILTPLGLEDMIAESPEAFLDICEGLCANPERLAELRAGLRARIASSPLCNPRLRARQMERVYRAAWRRWCKKHDS